MRKSKRLLRFVQSLEIDLIAMSKATPGSREFSMAESHFMRTLDCLPYNLKPRYECARRVISDARDNHIQYQINGIRMRDPNFGKGLEEPTRQPKVFGKCAVPVKMSWK